MMITVERLVAAQSLVDKLCEQGQALYADIAETAQDRARLLQEVEQNEHAIDKLTGELQQLREQVRQLEHHNRRLEDDATILDSKLADANTRLESIFLTAKADAAPPTPRTNGDHTEAAGKAGLAALKNLAVVATRVGTDRS